MTTAAKEGLRALLQTPCQCEEAFTARNTHASDCHYDFIRWFLSSEEIDEILLMLKGLDTARAWLRDPNWPQFGPGISPGPLDPGRQAARAAVAQVIDAIEGHR